MILKFSNLTHLGDNIYDSILLNSLPEYQIEYFIHPANRKNVKEWFLPHVELVPFMPKGAREIWITHTLWGCVHGTEKQHPGCIKHPTPWIYNQVYFDHFKSICQAENIPFKFQNKDDICHTQSEMDIDGEKWDWLFINSQCFSGQIDIWDEKRFANIARSLPGRVITTYPVKGLPCTRDEYPTLFNIGQLAGRCRFIAGIHTGPMCACLTKYALANMEKLICLDKEHSFVYGDKVEWARNIEEFEGILNRIKLLF